MDHLRKDDEEVYLKTDKGLGFHDQIKKDFIRSHIDISRHGKNLWAYPEYADEQTSEVDILDDLYYEMHKNFSRWAQFRRLSPQNQWNLIHNLLFWRTQYFEYPVMERVLDISGRQAKKLDIKDNFCFSNNKVRFSFSFERNKAFFQTEYVLSVGDGDINLPPIGKYIGRLKVRRWMSLSSSNLTPPIHREVITIEHHE